MKKIVLASDHAGYSLKESLKEFLKSQWSDLDIKDVGTHTAESCDYPIFAGKAAKAVAEGVADMGLVMCGSGNGVSMVANKCLGVRCCLAWNREVARLGRAHNNANMLALPARFITVEEAKEIVFTFMQEEFEGGRHLRRVEMVDKGCL